MKAYETENIRNVAVVGHSGTGKTQLTSAILFDSEMVNRLGRVDDGTTTTDFDEEEISRHHTLSASVAYAEWNKHKVNLIDTPGFANFISDARAAMRVCDVGLVVVDAVSGIEVQTEKVWSIAEEFELPRLIVLNRLDRERASIKRSLESLQTAFGRTVIPVQLPLGDEKSFRGIIDLVGMKAITFEPDGTGTPTETEIPEDSKKDAEAAREALVEMVVETDEVLLEKFFETGTLTQNELTEGLRKATIERKVFPMFCTSALLNIGVQALLDGILALAPSPTEHPLKATKVGTEEVVECPALTQESLISFVWKTIADPFAGRLTLFRVVSGTLKSDATIFNLTKNSNERVGSLLLLQGKDQTSVSEVRAGDLCAVAKLKETQTSDTLAEKEAAVVLPPIKFAEPVLAYAIEPKNRGDEEKIGTSLHRLEEEDPTIQYSRDAQTDELLLSGQGQLHIEVTVAKLKRRFGVEVNLKLPRVPYRETITAATEAHGRHKKQSGGHGQFGDCKIRLEPLPRGTDFEFVNEIFGGSIPKQFIPAVEKGVQDSRQRGFVAGYPVVDFKVTLFDGSFHQVDSNELSFRMAGSLAFKDGMSRARPTLLEPVMTIEVSAPNDSAGDLMGDLNGRRGRISGMETRGTTTVIKAKVPMAEILTYEQHLTSVTGGRSSYHMEYSHFEEVPSHLQQKIVAAAKAERGENVGTEG